MTPIIQPYLFYLADLASVVRMVFSVITAILGILVMLAVLEYTSENKWESITRVNKNILKICSVVLLFSLIVVIFVPTTETVYKMIIAQNVTNDNLAKALEIIKQSIDYLVDVIQ